MKILGSEVPNKCLLLFVGERSYQVIIDLVVLGIQGDTNQCLVGS